MIAHATPGLMVVAAALVSIALAGCSRGDDAADSTTIAPATTPTTSTLVPTTRAATTPPTTVAATPAATVPPTTAAPPTTLPDGATVLQQSFDQLAGGYHFVTTATVNGTPALTAEGDHIAGNTRMTITSQGKAVDYIVLPDQTWVGEAGNWQELDEPAPASDPISALRTPESVTVTNYSPELTTVTGSYPPGALALAGDQPVTVEFELAGTTLRAIAYEVPGGTSNVRAEISAVVDPTPITSPGGE